MTHISHYNDLPIGKKTFNTKKLIRPKILT